MGKHSVEFGILSLEETLVVCNLMLSGGCITFPTGTRALHRAFCPVWEGEEWRKVRGGLGEGALDRGWLLALVGDREVELCVPRAFGHQA